MPYESKDNWKDRLIKEYEELKERTEKINKMVCKLEIEMHLGDYYSKEMKIQKTIRYDLMKNQLFAMREYLHYLELRAELEGIEL